MKKQIYEIMQENWSVSSGENRDERFQYLAQKIAERLVLPTQMLSHLESYRAGFDDGLERAIYELEKVIKLYDDKSLIREKLLKALKNHEYQRVTDSDFISWCS